MSDAASYHKRVWEWEHAFQPDETGECIVCKNAITKADKNARIPTPMERRLLYSLLWVWNYYGQCASEDPLLLEHRNMSAGEEATALLEEFGLAIDQGYCAQVTPAGKALMETEEDEL